MRRRRRDGAVLLGVAGAVALAVAPVLPRTAVSAAFTPPHIMVIVEENAGYTSAQGSPFIIGNDDAPYINSLATTYTSATHWFANQHNSPNDYLDLISGSNQGLSDGIRPPYTATTLVDELNTAGISWKAYMESMPSDCANGSTTLYSSDHNPFSYFSDYHSLCSGGNGVVPFTQPQLSTDLNSSHPPDFVWITPNVCDDMHSGGPTCPDNVVANGDTWLSDTLPTVLSSSWYADGGIIILTWDESANGDKSGGTFGTGGQIPNVVISADSSGSFPSPGDHFATLRGIEEAYGVPLLGESADPSFGDIEPAFDIPIFVPPPAVTGVTPPAGAQGGGAIVSIAGTNFSGRGYTASDLLFGGADVPGSNHYPCPGSSAGCFAVDSSSHISVFTPGAAQPGTVDVRVVTAGGVSAPGSADEYAYVAPGAYTALTPYRVCDTRARSGTSQCEGKTLGAHGVIPVQISGNGGVPAGAEAAVVNLTAIDHGSQATYITAFPTGGAVPLASNINLTGGAVQANLATVRLSSGGQMSVFNSVSLTDVIVDIEGYFAAPSASGAGAFHSMSPVRVCDTRGDTHTGCAGTRDNPLVSNTWREVVLSGTRSIPTTGAAAAVFNLTATQGSEATFLSVAPPAMATDKCPSSAPTSNLNPRAGEALANRVIVPLGPRQDVCVYNSLGSIDFIIDVNGWFGDGTESPAGALFYPVAPTRICDTRAGSPTRCAGQFLAAGSTETIQVAGVAVVPRDGGSTPPVAVVANLTGVAGTANTYLSMYPGDVTQRPGVSDLNPSASEVIANLAVVALATTGGSSGAVDLFNAAGDVNAILDIAGWFQ